MITTDATLSVSSEWFTSLEFDWDFVRGTRKFRRPMVGPCWASPLHRAEVNAHVRIISSLWTAIRPSTLLSSTKTCPSTCTSPPHMGTPGHHHRHGRSRAPKRHPHSRQVCRSIHPPPGHLRPPCPANRLRVCRRLNRVLVLRRQNELYKPTGECHLQR
jgi:hypothetical protein